MQVAVNQSISGLAPPPPLSLLPPIPQPHHDNPHQRHSSNGPPSRRQRPPPSLRDVPPSEEGCSYLPLSINVELTYPQCDLQRPSCGQCRKACIPCGGYVRKKAALDSKPLTWQPREYGSQTPEPSSLPTPPDSTNDRHRHLQRLRHRLGSTDLITSGPVSRSAEHDRLIGTFWEAFLPNSEPFPPGTFQITLGGSVDDIKKLSQNNSTLHKGLLAIALTTLGKRTSSSWMKEEGFRLYGEALKSMSQSLRPDKWTTDQMVVTRLFSVYEVLLSSNLSISSNKTGSSWSRCKKNLSTRRELESPLLRRRSFNNLPRPFNIHNRCISPHLQRWPPPPSLTSHNGPQKMFPR